MAEEISIFGRGDNICKGIELKRKGRAFNFEKTVKEKQVIQDMDEKKAGLNHSGSCRALFKKQW